MSNPTLHQTRQQLDDLDSLIQRMLSLPLSHLDEEEAQKLQESARIPAEEFAPLPFPNRQMINEAKITSTPRIDTPDSSVMGWKVEFGDPIRVPETNRLVSLPPTAVEITPEELVPYASVVVEEVPRPALPTPQPALSASNDFVVPILWPFYLITRIFDMILGRGPTAWMTRPFGKHLVGVAGIAMIIGALVWAYLDWTEFRWTVRNSSSNISEFK
jgi:hypothetical protein